MTTISIKEKVEQAIKNYCLYVDLYFYKHPTTIGDLKADPTKKCKGSHKVTEVQRLISEMKGIFFNKLGNELGRYTIRPIWNLIEIHPNINSDRFLCPKLPFLAYAKYQQWNSRDPADMVMAVEHLYNLLEVQKCLDNYWHSPSSCVTDRVPGAIATEMGITPDKIPFMAIDNILSDIKSLSPKF